MKRTVSLVVVLLGFTILIGARIPTAAAAPHIHAGIHGIGDLDPARRDWRKPVAQITIGQIR